MAIAAVKPSMRRSSASPTNTGLFSVLRKAISARLNTCASATPRAVPSTASSRLSESNWHDQAAARSADGLAHRHLAFAHAGPRQQQVGQVGARDQQDQSGGRQQQPQRTLVLLAQVRDSGCRCLGHELVCQESLGLVGAIRRRQARLHDRRRYRFEIVVGALLRPSRLEPAHGGEPPLRPRLWRGRAGRNIAAPPHRSGCPPPRRRTAAASRRSRESAGRRAKARGPAPRGRRPVRAARRRSSPLRPACRIRHGRRPR